MEEKIALYLATGVPTFLIGCFISGIVGISLSNIMLIWFVMCFCNFVRYLIRRA